MGNKIYINITNHCNLACPFCCMYSSPKKNTFMSADTFKSILDKYDPKDTIIQLEGGEPTTHPEFALMVYYASKIRGFFVIVDTNGVNLSDYLLSLGAVYKVSINTYVLKFLSVKDLKRFYNFDKLQFNVRYSNNLQRLFLKLKTWSFRKRCTYHSFNSYGRAKNWDLPELNINQVYNNWECFASDGTSFKTDLISRSEYEFAQI